MSSSQYTDIIANIRILHPVWNYGVAWLEQLHSTETNRTIQTIEGSIETRQCFVIGWWMLMVLICVECWELENVIWKCIKLWQTVQTWCRWPRRKFFDLKHFGWSTSRTLVAMCSRRGVACCCRTFWFWDGDFAAVWYSFSRQPGKQVQRCRANALTWRCEATCFHDGQMGETKCRLFM